MFDRLLPEHDPLRADVLARRLRVGMWLVLGSLASFAIADLLLRPPNWLVLMALKVPQVVCVLAAFAVLHGRRDTRVAVLVAALTLAVVYPAVALSGWFSQDTATTPLTFVTLAIGSASLLPWGARIQAASVVWAAVVLGALSVSLWGGSSAVAVYQSVAVAVAFVGSVWIADVVDKGQEEKARALRAEAALRSSEASLSSVFDAAGVYVATFELQGDDYSLAAANRPVADFFGVGVGELIGRTGREIGLPDPVRAYWVEQLQACAGREGTSVVQGTVPVDGEIRHFEASVSPVHDPEARFPRFHMIAVDATARHHAEQELRALNRGLEHRVLERTRELEDANRELEAFAYSVSHDLRTPLRAIEGFGRVLDDEFGDTLAPAARGYLERIRHGAASMAQLIDDILRLSRVGRRELQLAPVEMAEVFRTQLDRLREQEPERSVVVEIESMPACRADRTLVELAVQNLVENAWKYSRDRHPAVIHCGVVHESGARNTYFVRDNGCGFDMEYADKLFRPFHRLHRSDEYEGSGVGLATVARVVARHGGDVRVESRPDQGATFYFSLPTSSPALAATGS